MTACCCLCTRAGQHTLAGMLHACKQPLRSCGTDFALQAQDVSGQQMQAFINLLPSALLSSEALFHHELSHTSRVC